MGTLLLQALAIALERVISSTYLSHSLSQDYGEGHNAYRHWYNTQRIHSALGVLTPQEAWDGMAAPRPVSYLACRQPKLQIRILRSKCRGDPRLRVLHISLPHAA